MVYLFDRASNLHPSLPAAVRYLRRRSQVRRLLELLERRSLPLPVQPRTCLRQGIPCVHVGWPGPRVQKRGYVTQLKLEEISSKLHPFYKTCHLFCGLSVTDINHSPSNLEIVIQAQTYSCYCNVIPDLNYSCNLISLIYLINNNMRLFTHVQFQCTRCFSDLLRLATCYLLLHFGFAFHPFAHVTLFGVSQK